MQICEYVSIHCLPQSTHDMEHHQLLQVEHYFLENVLLKLG